MVMPPKNPYKFVCPKCGWQSPLVKSDVIPPLGFGSDSTPESSVETTEKMTYSGASPQCPKCYAPLNKKTAGILDKLFG